MLRRNLYDILAEMDFDFRKEYQSLLFLFSGETIIFGSNYTLTLKKYVDSYYFRSLEIRRSFNCIDELMTALGLHSNTSRTEHLFLLCELLLALLPEEKLQNNRDAKRQAVTIKNSIKSILDRTNHELTEIEPQKYIVVEKNRAASQAASLVADESIAIDLLEYNHYSLKGDLAGKRKILSSIGQYIEPDLNSRMLQKAGYGQLESDAGFLLNNFHVRHNNKEGKKAQEYILELGDAALEEWYDKIYNTLLSVIIIKEQLAIQNELAGLKSFYTWRT